MKQDFKIFTHFSSTVSRFLILYIFTNPIFIIQIVKLREREGQGVDPGRSLKGHLWMVDGGWWYTFP